MKSNDGKRMGSSFRMNRYNNDHKEEGGEKKPEEKGARSQSRDIEATHPNPDETMGDEPMQEPGGDHEEVKQMVAEHGPAHTINITHDHQNGQHHVHHVHQDGFEHHADHPTPEHAHRHAAHAAGLTPPEEPGEEPMPSGGDQDDYKPEPL